MRQAAVVPASRCRQITMPAPHHSIFVGRMLFLTPNQQCQSTEGKQAAVNTASAITVYTAGKLSNLELS